MFEIEKFNRYKEVCLTGKNLNAELKYFDVLFVYDVLEIISHIDFNCLNIHESVFSNNENSLSIELVDNYNNKCPLEISMDIDNSDKTVREIRVSFKDGFPIINHEIHERDDCSYVIEVLKQMFRLNVVKKSRVRDHNVYQILYKYDSKDFKDFEFNLKKKKNWTLKPLETLETRFTSWV